MSKANSPDGQPDRPPLALIAGPTASGKSDLGLRLARALVAQGRRAVIVNADSAQVYADLAVLSARPSPAEMREVEHHLFGAWDGATACSAADWAEAARRVIQAAHASGAVPILVGGTGLYLRTLLEGIAPVPPIDAAIRAEVRAMPQTDARDALLREDPERALTLAPADAARTTRALEVVRSTSRTLTDWQSQRAGGIGGSVTLHARILLPDRAWLYERCDRRFAAMLDQGAIGEVEALLARRLDSDLPVMRAIGVAVIARYLAGDCSLDEARQAGAQATRNYAKRQFTWFNRQPPVEWARIAEIDIIERLEFETLLQH